jgi:tetratricopeptide (TPR) repeat protein
MTPMQTADGRSLPQVLRSMERQAARADFPDMKARIYNLMGDLCFDAGERDQCLEYYGTAIDHYITGQRFDSAAAVCRKVVRIAPHVVRARCTLAWIAIGKGLFSEAQREVTEYATAAERAGREELAREHLRRMAQGSDSELRQALAETLLNLGDDEGADRLFRTVFGSADEDEVLAGEDADTRWKRVVEAVVSPATS